jgi:hypothetical protein
MCRALGAGKIPEGSKFDMDTLKAMCRVNAKETAYDIASRGAKIVLNAGAGDAGQMLTNTNLAGVQSKMQGTTEDMDKVSAKLREIFRK